MAKPKEEKDSNEIQLGEFCSEFTPEIAACAQEILTRIHRRFRHAIALAYDNYNALAIGFGPNERARDAIVSSAVFIDIRQAEASPAGGTQRERCVKFSWPYICAHVSGSREHGWKG